jgi:beta-phosphoglucomutase-like phosphatase (HAD superfamily)
VRLALLLDLDGVLVDTERPALAALARTFADHGAPVDPAEVDRRFRGRNLDHCPDEVADVLGGDVPAGFVATARARARAGPAPRAEPGALGLLSTAAVRRVVTNSSIASARRTLHAAGLGGAVAPDEVVSVERAGRAKPAPDLYLTALDDLGLAAAECLAVEDSLAGLRAARAAGVPAVGYAPTLAHRRVLDRAGFATVGDLAAVREMVG